MTNPKLQLIELWCEKMHTVNRRLTGTVQIEEGNDKFEHILGRAKSEDGEIHLGAGKNIHFSKVILISPVSDDNPSRKIYQLTPKSSRYSEESYLYLEKIDALTCVFLCFTLDENEPPVIALPYQFQCIEVDTNWYEFLERSPYRETFDLGFGFLNENKWNLPNRDRSLRICKNSLRTGYFTSPKNIIILQKGNS